MASAAQVILVLAAVSALALAVLLGWRGRQARARLGLPAGEVLYADTGPWERGQPLYAPRHRLAGKPDYLVRLAGETIPVEVKPGRLVTTPYPSDVLQLAAYCLLVEETTGQRPSYGLLRYQERTFRIPFDDALRRALLAVLDAMRRDLRAPDLARSHADPVRCRHCGHRQRCGQSLGQGD